MLLDLQPVSVVQTELDWGAKDSPREGRASGQSRVRLMQALDSINVRFGKGSMHMASAGLAGERREWSMKQERRTPAYTTRWSDIPLARA